MNLQRWFLRPLLTQVLAHMGYLLIRLLLTSASVIEAAGEITTSSEGGEDSESHTD